LFCLGGQRRSTQHHSNPQLIMTTKPNTTTMKQVLKSLLTLCVIASVASQKTGSQRRRLKVNLIISYLRPACRRLLRFHACRVSVGDAKCRYVVLLSIEPRGFCFDNILLVY
jgi:hypothetical protein